MTTDYISYVVTASLIFMALIAVYWSKARACTREFKFVKGSFWYLLTGLAFSLLLIVWIAFILRLTGRINDP